LFEILEKENLKTNQQELTYYYGGKT